MKQFTAKCSSTIGVSRGDYLGACLFSGVVDRLCLAIEVEEAGDIGRVVLARRDVRRLHDWLGRFLSARAKKGAR